jgi:hypothetical protein
MKEIHVLEAVDLAHFFPVRIELVYERNTSYKSSFQGGERVICSK